MDYLQRHSFALELLMDVRVIRWRVQLLEDDLGKQRSLQGRIVQVLRKRPAEALLARPMHVIGDRALGEAGRHGNPLVTEFRLELETQNFSDFAHGTPLGWHRLSRDRKNRAA